MTPIELLVAVAIGVHFAGVVVVSSRLGAIKAQLAAIREIAHERELREIRGGRP